MAWDFLKADTVPRLPKRSSVVAAMAVMGALTGLISCLPSPLPEFDLDEGGLILNAVGMPLHAGLTFAAGIALCLWLWVTRDLGKCLLALVLIFVGWLAALNTANDLYQVLIGSEVFGTALGAKANREVLGLIVGGVIGGAVGAGLTVFGTGIPVEALRRPENWSVVVLAGAVFGLMLYPAASLRQPALLYVPWQTIVAVSIAFALTARKT